MDLKFILRNLSYFYDKGDCADENGNVLWYFNKVGEREKDIEVGFVRFCYCWKEWMHLKTFCMGEFTPAVINLFIFIFPGERQIRYFLLYQFITKNALNLWTKKRLKGKFITFFHKKRKKLNIIFDLFCKVIMQWNYAYHCLILARVSTKAL